MTTVSIVDARLAALETETHVWYGGVDELTARFGGDRERWLSPAEFTRCEKYVHEADRRSFVAGRILLKNALSCYLRGVPTEWRIAIGAKGAIGLDASQNTAGIKLNLSRRRQYVACVVSLRRCGVDIEETQRQVDEDAMYQGVFTNSERRVFDALPPEERASFFYRIWCHKEAYVKALGVGFYLDPTLFTIELDHPDGARSIEAQTRGGTNGHRAERFRFAVHYPAREHLLVAAHEQGPGEQLSFVFRHYKAFRKSSGIHFVRNENGLR